MRMEREFVVQNVYHLVNRAARYVANDGEPHDLSLSCWCEPAVIPMGQDVAGRPIVVMNHHQRGLFCCRTHHPTGELAPCAAVGTGLFSHLDEGVDAVPRTGRATTGARIYSRPTD
ncbi:MAG TPA: hypothetical protein VHN13_11020 [Candidatus Tectomicrobia bacterium]|jgi:hypothetical protein|nr:hypothetical protein [Candidatus Tectomicrobia bacterium]